MSVVVVEVEEEEGGARDEDLKSSGWEYSQGEKILQRAQGGEWIRGDGVAGQSGREQQEW
jgi:hypothetical protein